MTEPLVIAGHHAPSRVVFGPHETNLCRGRSLTARHTAYYERRAQGGAGVIITETASVHASDWPYERAPLAQQCAAGWREVADRCHAHGALVLASLGHRGLQGVSAYGQQALWGPSRVADVVSRELPVYMEAADIDALIEGFRAAAALAVEAGMDGVEVDAGPKALLRQFLSPLTNQREDEYGADRALLLRRVIAVVREACGDGVLALRLSCDELAPWGGITPAQAAATAASVADSIDLLTVVRGGPTSAAAYRPDGHTAPGFNRELCREIRGAVTGKTLVVLQGSITDLGLAQAALDEGVADAVELTRAQIAEPDVVAKDRSGLSPRPCLLCNQTCLVDDPRNFAVTCVANSEAGHERPAAVLCAGSAAVLVVGAGPAGLEAARVLALHGAPVHLVERSGQLGGMVRVAARGHGRGRLVLLVDWLESECRRLGVRIDTGVRAGSVVGGTHEYAAVVVATGAKHTGPQDTGAQDSASQVDGRPHRSLLSAADVLGGSSVTPPVVVVDPVGGPVAVSVAELLADRGVAVSIVTADLVVGKELAVTGDLADANRRLQRAGVDRHLACRIREFHYREVVLEDVHTQHRRTIPAGTVVDCGPGVADAHGTESPGGVVRVGDCVAPRTVAEAVREGHAAATAVLTALRTALAAAPEMTLA